MWHTWDHPAQDGEPCGCPVVWLWGSTLSSPVLPSMVASLFRYQSCPAPGSHESWSERLTRALLTSLKIWGFILVYEAPGRMTLAVM